MTLLFVKNRRKSSYFTKTLLNDKWSDTVNLDSNRDRHVVGVRSQGATEVRASLR